MIQGLKINSFSSLFTSESKNLSKQEVTSGQRLNIKCNNKILCYDRKKNYGSNVLN